MPRTTAHRFVIHDLHKNGFAPYKFKVNPTEMQPLNDTNKFAKVVTLNGRRGVIRFPRRPETRTMSWDRMDKDMLDELIVRKNSRHDFLIVDHNKERFTGQITEITADEIVATVPSKYKVSLTIVGTEYRKGVGESNYGRDIW